MKNKNLHKQTPLDSTETLKLVQQRKAKQEKIKANHAKHRELRNKRLLGKANSKTGNVTVFFKNSNGEMTTKVFPSKGLLRNQEFKDWSTNKNIVEIRFKRKRGDKDKEVAKSKQANVEHRAKKQAEKKLRAEKRCKEEYDSLAKKAVENAEVNSWDKKNKSIINNLKPFKSLTWKEIKNLNKESLTIDKEKIIGPIPLVEADTDLKQAA